MTKLHITNTHGTDGEFVAILNGVEVIVEDKMIANMVLDGITVTFEDDNAELYKALKCLTIKFVEVATDADGSGEHDVYLHEAIVAEDEIKMNHGGGQHIKTYKREASAIKFAHTIAKDVRIS